MKNSNDLSRKEHHEQKNYICDEYECEKQLSSRANLMNHINAQWDCSVGFFKSYIFECKSGRSSIEVAEKWT